MSNKILIIRFSSIGDIVLTTPVIRCLRLQSNAELHYLTKPPFADIVLENPHVTKVIILADNFESMIQLLKAENYDLVIDLHNNIRSARIKLALHKPSVSFRKLNLKKWLIVNFKIDKLPDLHIVDRYFETVTSLGVQNDGKGLDFFIPPAKVVDVKTELGVDPGNYTAIVIGAAHATKCMTIDQIAQLIEFIHMPVVLLGGRQETAKAIRIISKSKSKTVFNACGPFDISQSASILQQATKIITHDTGMMHIAAALQKQQSVVWGNTISGFGMYPYYGDAEHAGKASNFEVSGLSCRPCSKIGYAKCPKGHFKCMLNHDLESIARS
ncbi:MAG: glycosyltransferase family 9 protein [Bacteroidota bacterium]|nr:glycosyltransferase family 9 protein [Bacteroidota bacterium]